MPDMDVFCDICGKRHDGSSLDVRPIENEWHCTDESACFERKAAAPAVLDARDNPVPVVSAREDLEALLHRLSASYELVDMIMKAADRYASAATADHAGLDAMLGPVRLAAAESEMYEPREG